MVPGCLTAMTPPRGSIRNASLPGPASEYRASRFLASASPSVERIGTSCTNGGWHGHEILCHLSVCYLFSNY